MSPQWPSILCSVGLLLLNTRSGGKVLRDAGVIGIDRPRSIRRFQRPKNSHNRMITGIGTPISQSKSPRPIAAS
jgi:hypothetical protein